jgi:hypothetical protein
MKKIEGRKAYLPCPWAIPPADEYTLNAFRAFREGVASQAQQVAAFDWIVNATGYYESGFRGGPDGDRETAFAEGKRFIGGLMVSMSKTVLKQP